MGVQDLYKELKARTDAIIELDYSDLLENNISSVAIDGYALLHASVSTCAMELCDGIISPKFLTYCTSKIKLFTDNGVRVVLILDGNSAPMKAMEAAERSSRRADALQNFKKSKHLSHAEQYKMAIKAAPIVSQMPSSLALWCKMNGVEVIRAPYEADPQMAALYHDGYVDAVVSEDSDLVCYGVRHIIRNFTTSRSLQLITFQAISDTFYLGADDIRATKYLLWYGMLLGQDYIKRIKSFGPKNIFKFMTALMAKNLDDATSAKALLELFKKCSGAQYNESYNQYFDLPFPKSIPETYPEDFSKAVAAFVFSIYYCPKTQTIRYLHDPNNINNAEVYAYGVMPIRMDKEFINSVAGSFTVPAGHESWKSYCEFERDSSTLSIIEEVGVTLKCDPKLVITSSQSSSQSSQEFSRPVTAKPSELVSTTSRKKFSKPSSSRFLANLGELLPNPKDRRE